MRQPLSSITLISAALRSGTSERSWAEGARLITVLNDGPKALTEADLRTLRNAMGDSISADVVAQILSQLTSLEALLDLKKQVGFCTDESINRMHSIHEQRSRWAFVPMNP